MKHSGRASNGSFPSSFEPDILQRYEPISASGRRQDSGRLPAANTVSLVKRRRISHFARLVETTGGLAKRIRRHVSHFTRLDDAAAAQLEPELVNWTGHRSSVVAWAGNVWVVKRSNSEHDLRRELLVYALANGLVNAAEIVRLSQREVDELFRMDLVVDGAGPNDTLLVRLAQDHSAAELPLPDVDAATAGELVFSLWVRRRDATRHNRALTPEGIPVFFDLHASLDFEPRLRDRRTFFADSGGGYAGSWRVMEVSRVPPDTLSMRRSPINLYIRDRDRFVRAAHECVHRIQSERRALGRMIRACGYWGKQAAYLAQFLESTRQDLPGDVEVMLRHVFAPTTHAQRSDDLDR